MKLRNKKTGEIWNIPHRKEIVMYDGKVKYTYKSLAEVSENWEDYNPKEPLIKDEKIRKAVRAWADVVGKNKTFVVSYNAEYHDCCIYDGGLSDTAMIDLGTDLNVREGSYTIIELCGEEE